MFESLDVSFDVPGPLNVLLLDITGNANGFEHGVSEYILHKLLGNGVSVVDQRVYGASTSQEIMDIMSNKQFTALMLFAHGGPPHGCLALIGRFVPLPSCLRNRVHAQIAMVAEDPETPYHIELWALESLQNKLVTLCVCHGFGFDFQTALYGSGGAAVLIASGDRVSKKTAKQFFPDFYVALARSGGSEASITYQSISAAFKSANKGEMSIYPPD